MLKSRTNRAFVALALLVLSSIQIATTADAKDNNPRSMNGGEVQTAPAGNIGSGQAAGRKSLAQRRAACYRQATDSWFDDKRECNRRQESRTGQGRRECEAAAYLSYQIEQGKCSRMQ